MHYWRGWRLCTWKHIYLFSVTMTTWLFHQSLTWKIICLFLFTSTGHRVFLYVCKLNQQEQTNLKQITNKHQMNAWLICPGIANASVWLFRSPSILCIELFMFSIQFESNLIMSSFAWSTVFPLQHWRFQFMSSPPSTVPNLLDHPYSSFFLLLFLISSWKSTTQLKPC